MSNPSKVEIAKQNGNLLRGSIAETLESAATHFQHDDLQLLKFHGTYQQDDRDKRIPLRQQGLDKSFQFMIRCTIPGGLLTAQQYLDLDQLADQYADGSLRITTRQSVQLHGVLKGELRSAISEINQSLLTTLAACGDVQRNVMACAAPLSTPAHRMVRQVARDLGQALMPKTLAYHEIWIDGSRQNTVAPETETEDFYGEDYLPRKFKTGVTLDGENSIDVYSCDAGLMGIVEGDQLTGFNVLAGGGLGMSHGRENTFAQLSHEICFVDAEHAVAAITVIGTIYRDYGNRDDRKHARLKYLIDEMGLPRFRELFSRRAEFPFTGPRATRQPHFRDYLGVHPQGDGRFFYGLFIQSGRVRDTPGKSIRTALREIVETVRPGITLTAQQSILLTDLTEKDVERVESILRRHEIDRIETLSAIRRYSMACPALPTCGMAVAESERVVQGVIDHFEKLLRSLSVDHIPLTLRMTGCPNGCARPYTADIALVGRRAGIYHIFVGGRLAGDRVTDLFAADVPLDQVVSGLTPLITAWAKNRNGEEGLGDYYRRLTGIQTIRRRVTGKETQTRPLVPLKPLVVGPGGSR